MSGSPRLAQKGFTIVELLIVIVVIGILAALALVSYNGIKARADEASLKSELSSANRKVHTYKTTNSEAFPVDTTTAGISVSATHSLYYRLTPDGKNFCLAVAMQDAPEVVFSATSTN